MENSSQLCVFWPRRELHANHGTVRKSAIFPQPSNQKQLKWSNTAYVLLSSRVNLCVFQVTRTWFCMKVIRIFITQPVKIPRFKSLLTRKQALVTPFFFAFFLMFISWMLITPSFKKSLIAEQFQGNYLNPSRGIWNRRTDKRRAKRELNSMVHFAKKFKPR